MLKQLFYPKPLRPTLPTELRQLLLVFSLFYFSTTAVVSFVAIRNSRAIDQTKLLTNTELLTLRMEAKKSPEQYAKYLLLRDELVQQYASQRQNQSGLILVCILSLMAAVSLFKIRKNLTANGSQRARKQVKGKK